MTTRLVKRPRVSPQQASKDPLERLRQNARKPVLPVPFAQALTVLLSEQKRVNRSRLQRIRAAWEMAVEQTEGLSQAARRAEVRNVSKTGAVHVIVDSPALAHELGVVYRSALLQRLRELLQGKDSVSDLVVKANRQRR